MLSNKHFDPPFRVPWGRLGWYAETCEWARGALRENSYEMSGLLEQLRVRPKTTVLKATSTTGDNFYIKCTGPPLNDAAVAQIWSTAAPELVMKPFKVDIEGRKMLCFDYGEIIESVRAPNGGVLKVVRDLAKLQNASTSCLDKLEATGLPVLTARRMEDQLDEVLHSKAFNVLEKDDVLEKLWYAKVRANIVAGLRKLGEVEAEVGISFVHWDWESENVHRSKGESESYCFFDYDQSFIGMCAFDINSFRDPEEFKVYATELGITPEQARRRQNAVLGIGCVQELFHAYHNLRSTADVQAEK